MSHVQPVSGTETLAEFLDHKEVNAAYEAARSAATTCCSR